MLFVEKVKNKWGARLVTRERVTFAIDVEKRLDSLKFQRSARVTFASSRAIPRDFPSYAIFETESFLEGHCSFDLRISLGSIQLNIFAGKTPERNLHLPEKEAILSSSSNRCPPTFLQKLQTLESAHAQKPCMRSSWQPLTVKKPTPKKKLCTPLR